MNKCLVEKYFSADREAITFNEVKVPYFGTRIQRDTLKTALKHIELGLKFIGNGDVREAATQLRHGADRLMNAANR